MTAATLVVELRPGERMTSFEADLAAFAAMRGSNLQRSGDPRHPCTYYMRQRYMPCAKSRPASAPGSTVVPLRQSGAK